MWKDPIVEEVRKERMEIERECGRSFEKISAQAMVSSRGCPASSR